MEKMSLPGKEREDKEGEKGKTRDRRETETKRQR